MQKLTINVPTIRDGIIELTSKEFHLPENLKEYVEMTKKPPERKTYIYVIDKRQNDILYALYCPDERTGKRACTMAKRETGHDGNNYRYTQSDVISVDSTVTIVIEPCSNSTHNKATHKDFSIDDFEFAETDTKRFLSKGDCNNTDNQTYDSRQYAICLDFMRAVDKALKELTGEAVPPVQSETSSTGNALLQGLASDFKQHMGSVNRFIQEVQRNPVESVLADYKQLQAATGVAVPDTTTAEQAYIDDSDGTVPNVNVVNQLTKKDIADGTFDGAFRALARFNPPEDETQIEKIHRLRCDDVEWNYIGRTIYHEENGKDIDEKDLPTYVDRLRKQHKGQYPHYYPAKK